MQTKLNPYFNFKGNARQAMEFYHSVFGGKLDLTSYKDGGMSRNQTDENQIMHAMLIADSDMTLMGSDVPDGMEYTPGTNVSISLSGDNETELSGYYERLAKGGTVQEPLKSAPWGDKFGMLIDPFGIRWMINITAKKI